MGRGRARPARDFDDVPLVATDTSSEDRTPHQRRVLRGLSDRSDVGGVPARREPQHADARRRPPALQEARGRGPQLHPRDVRADARRRGDRAAVPQAPPAQAEDRGPAGLGERRGVRHRAPRPARALPKPGRVRELLELCSRLHSTRLAWERPLWEAHVIEGLRDGRVAMYTKTHHALVDGISAMRLLQSVLSTDPDKRGMPAPWGVPGPVGQGRRRTARAGRAEPLRGPGPGAAHGDGHHRRGGRHAERPGPAPSTRACATRPPRCRSTRRAPSSTRRSPAPAASPPRTGRWSGSAPSARPAARR